METNRGEPSERGIFDQGKKLIDYLQIIVLKIDLIINILKEITETRIEKK